MTDVSYVIYVHSDTFGYIYVHLDISVHLDYLYIWIILLDIYVHLDIFQSMVLICVDYLLLMNALCQKNKLSAKIVSFDD
jgi:hypothetical protein